MLDKFESLRAVYVHLGENIPNHLILNLERHLNLFPKVKAVLVVDRSPSVKLDKRIEVFEYKRSSEIIELFNRASSYMDHNFRQGFWIHTFERFFAIEHFHKTNHASKIIHIESDVILMPNFPWDEFNEVKKLAWLNVNDQNDIAALVFLDSLEHTENLSAFLRKTLLMNPMSTDMSALREFAKLNLSAHTYLPSISKENKRAKLNQVLLPGEDHTNLFNGIFDPLALGIWLFGQDPKNNYGIVKRYLDQSHHYVDASKMNISYESGRLFDQKERNIYSLHIHSKNKKLFGPEWEIVLIKMLNEAKERKNSRYIDLSALVFALSERTPAQHLWHYLSRNSRLYDFVHTGAVKSITIALKRLLRI